MPKPNTLFTKLILDIIPLQKNYILNRKIKAANGKKFTTNLSLY